MGKTTKPSEARLKEILRRQSPPGWGANYLAAIKATREEAPPESRPAQVWSGNLKREMHTLSIPEQHVLMIAMLHPGLFELHDQRMLSYLPAPHPLDLHPRGGGCIRPRLRGTLEVSDSLDLLRHHATVVIKDPDLNMSRTVLPFPWIGDLLLFLEDRDGLYCVNWTIKDTPEDFERPPLRKRSKKDPAKAIEHEKARHLIEAIYYLDAGIRTVRITGLDYDHELAANLVQIFGSASRQHPFSIEAVKEFVNYFKVAMGTSTPAMEVVCELASLHRCKAYDVKTVLHQAIRDRQLRIDLSRPFLIDHPLLPEKKDPLDAYAQWFSRS